MLQKGTGPPAGLPGRKPVRYRGGKGGPTWPSGRPERPPGSGSGTGLAREAALAAAETVEAQKAPAEAPAQVEVPTVEAGPVFEEVTVPRPLALPSPLWWRPIRPPLSRRRFLRRDRW